MIFGCCQEWGIEKAYAGFEEISSVVCTIPSFSLLCTLDSEVVLVWDSNFPPKYNRSNCTSRIIDRQTDLIDLVSTVTQLEGQPPTKRETAKHSASASKAASNPASLKTQTQKMAGDGHPEWHTHQKCSLSGYDYVV